MLLKSFQNYVWAKLFQKHIRDIFNSGNFFSTTSWNRLICSDSITNRKSKTKFLNELENVLHSRKQYSSETSDCEDKDKNKDNDNQVEAKYRYHANMENAINKQISAEFTAAYSYLGLACYFGRSSVALLGTQKFFMDMYNEEIEHGMSLIKFQEMRGGNVKIDKLKPMPCKECSILNSLEICLKMEKEITEQLVNVIEIAKKQEDMYTVNYLTNEFIKEQLQAIRQLGILIALAERIGDCELSQYFMDLKMKSSAGH